MRLLDAHGEAMAGFDRIIRQVHPPQWHAPTPCTEWTVRDLVNHVVAEQLWVPHLLAGATLDEVGDRYVGDVLGADPLARWRQAHEAARRAWLTPGVLDQQVHVSGGRISAVDYGWQMTIDLAVHGWDLAIAIETAQPIDENLAGELLAIVEPQVDDWHDIGIVEPSIPVPDEASKTDQLVALLGRQPR